MIVKTISTFLGVNFVIDSHSIVLSEGLVLPVSGCVKYRSSYLKAWVNYTEAMVGGVLKLAICIVY